MFSTRLGKIVFDTETEHKSRARVNCRVNEGCRKIKSQISRAKRKRSAGPAQDLNRRSASVSVSVTNQRHCANRCCVARLGERAPPRSPTSTKGWWKLEMLLVAAVAADCRDHRLLYRRPSSAPDAVSSDNSCAVPVAAAAAAVD